MAPTKRRSPKRSPRPGSAPYGAPAFDKFERNAVFRAIRTVDLDPDDFSLHAQARRTFRLSHIDGAYFEAIPISKSFRSGPLAIEASGSEKRAQHRISFSWKGALSAWLRKVKQEIETPDLWEQFRAQQKLFETIPTDADKNTVFTADEQIEIQTQLEKARIYAFNSCGFSEDELSRLNTKLDELIESSRHARRFEWRDQMIGALLGAVASNLLPQEATLDVLQTVIRSTSHLLGHPGLLTP